MDLPDLPENSDAEFWGDAEKYIVNPKATNSEGPHYFNYDHANGAYCAHCGWGFLLDKGDSISEGHVYDVENHLVI